MSKAKKPKSTVPAVVINTEEALALSINRYVELHLRLAEATAIHEQNITRLNKEFGEQTREMVVEIDALISSCQLYCDRHRDLFPDGAKSRVYLNGTVGFRLNPTKVDKLLANDTWDAIAARLCSVPWGEAYLHQKDPTVNKEALLTHRADLTPEQLQQVGIAFSQGETFFIEPTSKAAPAVSVVKTAEAA